MGGELHVPARDSGGRSELPAGEWGGAEDARRGRTRRGGARQMEARADGEAKGEVAEKRGFEEEKKGFETKTGFEEKAGFEEKKDFEGKRSSEEKPDFEEKTDLEAKTEGKVEVNMGAKAEMVAAIEPSEANAPISGTKAASRITAEAAAQTLREVEAAWREGRFESLLQRDELRLGRALTQFHEAPIAFPPTFKLFRGEKGRLRGPQSVCSAYQTRAKDGSPRVPAYTDRVLWYSLPLCAQQLRPSGQYRMVEEMRDSDHRPVIMEFTLDTSKVLDVQDVESAGNAGNGVSGSSAGTTTTTTTTNNNNNNNTSNNNNNNTSGRNKESIPANYNLSGNSKKDSSSSTNSLLLRLTNVQARFDNGEPVKMLKICCPLPTEETKWRERLVLVVSRAAPL